MRCEAQFATFWLCLRRASVAKAFASCAIEKTKNGKCFHSFDAWPMSDRFPFKPRMICFLYNFLIDRPEESDMLRTTILAWILHGVPRCLLRMKIQESLLELASLNSLCLPFSFRPTLGPKIALGCFKSLPVKLLNSTLSHPKLWQLLVILLLTYI